MQISNWVRILSELTLKEQLIELVAYLLNN